MIPLVAIPALAVVLQLGPIEAMMLGGAALCGFMLVYTVFSSFSRPVSRSTLSRLESYIDREENLSPIDRFIDRAEEEQASARRGRRRDKSADMLPTLTRWLRNSPIRMLNQLSANLSKIGSNWRASEVLYAGVLAAALVFFIVGIVMQRVIPGLMLACLALYLPFVVVNMLAKRWMKVFEEQLADTLLLMSNATQAGYGFQQAMEMVAREGQPPMADEFTKMSQEVQLGVPIHEALQRMAERVKNQDFTLAVTAIQISMEVGGGLSEILRTISETIRERVRIRNEIGILTAQGKMTGMMLGGLPVFMFFLLGFVGSDPTSGEKYTDPLFDGEKYPMGPKMVWTGLFMQLIGFMVINKIVNIEI